MASNKLMAILMATFFLCSSHLYADASRIIQEKNQEITRRSLKGGVNGGGRSFSGGNRSLVVVTEVLPVDQVARVVVILETVIQLHRLCTEITGVLTIGEMDLIGWTVNRQLWLL